jgi:hypothetical protein
MTRFTLARDFRNIDPKLARIVLIEAGPRILPSFDPELSSRASTELERLGVQLWTNSTVTHINADGVFVGQEHLASDSVLWAAGVQASPLGGSLGTQQDPQGRVVVRADLSVPGYPEVLVIGDQACFKAPHMDRPLPSVATVAIQQGRHAAENICADLDGYRRREFRYLDKGQMATIGRRRAVMQRGGFRSAGVFAWLLWLLVHIYFLSGFRNRLFVLIQWGWSYLTFARGTRLIVEKEWRSYAKRRSSTELLAGLRSVPEETSRSASAVALRAAQLAAIPTLVPLDAPFTASVPPEESASLTGPLGAGAASTSPSTRPSSIPPPHLASVEPETALWAAPPRDAWDDEPTTGYRET